MRSSLTMALGLVAAMALASCSGNQTTLPTDDRVSDTTQPAPLPSAANTVVRPNSDILCDWFVHGPGIPEPTQGCATYAHYEAIDEDGNYPDDDYGLDVFDADELERFGFTDLSDPSIGVITDLALWYSVGFTGPVPGDRGIELTWYVNGALRGTGTFICDSNCPPTNPIPLYHPFSGLSLSKQDINTLEVQARPLGTDTPTNGVCLQQLEVRLTYNPCTTPPTKVTGLSATAPHQWVDLQWNAASAACGTVAYYEIFRVGAGIVGTSATTNYTDLTTVANTQYTFKVRAVDNLGNPGAWSNSYKIKTGDHLVIEEG